AAAAASSVSLALHAALPLWLDAADFLRRPAPAPRCRCPHAHDAILVMSPQIHAGIQAGDLIPVPVVHQRFQARREETAPDPPLRSEEHTSELQSRENLVCRL